MKVYPHPGQVIPITSSLAAQYPKSADQITAGAKSAFLAGDQSAYIAGIIVILVGEALVYLFFPTQAREGEMLREYYAEDALRVTEK